MTKRKSVEEKVNELEVDRENYISRKVENFEKKLRASYQAKIDLLREMGLPETKAQRKKAGRNLGEMMDKAKDRYVFYTTKYLEHAFHSSPESAKRIAEGMYERFRTGWMRSIMG